MRRFFHMGKELCDVPIQDDRQKYRAVIVVFASLSFFFAMLRIVSKVITEITWGADDTWAVVTLVCWSSMSDICTDNGKFILIPLTVFSLLGMAYSCLVWITHAFNALSAVAVLILYLTIGRSATYTLGSTAESLFNMNKYTNSFRIMLVHCIVNLAIDIWMLVLPMTQLYNIGLKLNKKVGVMTMFGLGIFLTAVSLIRTILQSQVLADPELAQTGQRRVVLWACIETYMGAIVACVLSTRQLATKVLYKMRKRKEGLPANNPIFIDRSLAPIADEEDILPLSDVGGLTTFTVSSGSMAVAETEYEMKIITKSDR
ncbi:hypothetical protein FANTH_11633 [Fusarium anthophilum]|uniref:Rhodopsin domain-containing protein n=1 Tax=Fusarium anthophilum TaxID=48485 RepID=A0A8H4YWF0_9HYPO|nr:hypothetical protein FANTH_11633 [Fusarium anthophilum]